MSQTFRLFHVSILSVLNFLFLSAHVSVLNFLFLSAHVSASPVSRQWSATTDDIISRRREITMTDLSFKDGVHVTTATLRGMLSRMPNLQVLIVDGPRRGLWM